MNDREKASSAVVIGGATGAITSMTIGGVGLAGMGTAIGIGIFSMTGVGAVVGLAGFGVYKAITKSEK